MALLPNEWLGPYQILSPLGAGGMGEVYKARDTRLDRIVAIKVASEQFSERVDREARAIAALNHSNICQLYDVAPSYLVMEYIEGRHLAGPLSLDQALKYAGQILDALAAAHEKGIVHRDLKPTNIMVAKSGVKLLDFGLARMEAAVAASDQTVTRALTGAGQILGTLQYMSPEQLHGQEAGPSSDIFSFGLVFYEMLTGKRAFDGPSAASLVAAILEREPPSLGAAAPPAVQAVLTRCLAKDPLERWQNARDVRIALELARNALPATSAAARAPRRFGWIYPSLAAVAMIGAGAIAVAHFTETKPEPMNTVFQLATIDGEGLSGRVLVSPDGKQLVARTAQGLVVRSLDSLTSRLLPGTRLAPSSGVSWSPDSRQLAFIGINKLQKVGIDGGPPQVLGDVASAGLAPPYTMWGPDGSILFTGPGSGLWKVSASGGTPVKVTMPPKAGEVALHMALSFLPDGRHFLFLTQGSKPEKNGIFVGSLDDPPGQEGKLLLNSMFGAEFAPDGNDRGYLLVRRNGALLAQPLDLKKLLVTGDALVVAPQVASAGPLLQASVSRTGVLAYAANNLIRETQLTWFERSGKRAGDIGPPSIMVFDLALSPDEKRVAYSAGGPNNAMDVWLLDNSSGAVPRRFTFEPSNFYRWPLWSPDGSRILFTSSRGFNSGGTFEKPVNGTGAQSRVDGIVGFPADWSRDGRKIVSTFEGDLWVWSGGKSERLTETPAVENMPRFSPDGKWIAYVSDETGRAEVWVQSYPATGAKYQVSTTGAVWPRWRADGKELFYISGSSLIASAVNSTPGLEIGAGKALLPVGSQSDYVVAGNGSRFLIRVAVGNSAPVPVTVMTNWRAVLKK